MDIVKLVKTLLPEPTWNSLSDRLRTKQRIQYLNFIKKYGLSEILQKNGPHYFIHIPKTGGTSIKNYLRDNDIPTLFLSHDIEDPKYKYPNEISKKNNPHAFTVVRNPFDRVVSAYYFLKKKKTNQKFYEKVLDEYDNFEDFVIKGLGKPESRLEIMALAHFMPQTEYIMNKKGNLCLAKENIFKFEKLDEKFNRYITSRGYEAQGLPILNKTNNRPDHRLLFSLPDGSPNEEMISIVVEAYKRDFEKLDYSKTL